MIVIVKLSKEVADEAEANAFEAAVRVAMPDVPATVRYESYWLGHAEIVAQRAAIEAAKMDVRPEVEQEVKQEVKDEIISALERDEKLDPKAVDAVKEILLAAAGADPLEGEG